MHPRGALVIDLIGLEKILKTLDSSLLAAPPLMLPVWMYTVV